MALLWVTAAAEDAAQKKCGVPQEYINDDYCDSPDGCDEPNTSACSTVAAVKRFACPDEGSGTTLIPASRIGDGVCDCCDGSDERAGACEDDCAAVFAAAERAAQAAREARAAGVAKMKTMACDAAAGKAEAAKVLATSETELEGLRAEIDAARATLDETRAKNDALRVADAEKTMHKKLLLDTLSGAQLRKLVVDVARETKGGDVLVRLARVANGLPEVEAPPEPEPADVPPPQEAPASEEPKPPSEEQEPPSEEAPASEEAEAASEEAEPASEEEPVSEEEEALPPPSEEEEQEEAPPPSEEEEEQPPSEEEAAAPPSEPPSEEPYEQVVELDEEPYAEDPYEDDPYGSDLYEDEAYGEVDATTTTTPGFADLDDEDFPDDEYGDIPDDVFPDDYPPSNWDDDEDYGYDYGEGRAPSDERLDVDAHADGDRSYLTARQRKSEKRLEAALRDLEDRRDHREKKLAKARDALDDDAKFGRDSALWALRNDCTSKKFSGYKYEVCFFKDAKQGSTRLGHYESFEAHANNVTKSLKFAHGDHCWNGPARSLEVALVCGADTQILDVDEPSTCVYKATVATPAVCVDDDATAPLDCSGYKPKFSLFGGSDFSSSSSSSSSKKKKKKRKQRRKAMRSPRKLLAGALDSIAGLFGRDDL